MSLFGLLAIVILGGVTITPQRVFSLGTVHPSSGLSHQGFPFGGPIQFILDCTCEMPNKLLIVLDFTTHASKFIKWESGKSKMYDFSQGGNFKIGQYILGTADFGGVCKYKVGNNCIDIKLDGIINAGPGAGTSGPLSGS